MTGCNVENATYDDLRRARCDIQGAVGRASRLYASAIVADTSATPPCGACRQILWEFGSSLEVRLANLTAERGPII